MAIVYCPQNARIFINDRELTSFIGPIEIMISHLEDIPLENLEEKNIPLDPYSPDLWNE